MADQVKKETPVEIKAQSPPQTTESNDTKNPHEVLSKKRKRDQDAQELRDEVKDLTSRTSIIEQTLKRVGIPFEVGKEVDRTSREGMLSKLFGLGGNSDAQHVHDQLEQAQKKIEELEEAYQKSAKRNKTLSQENAELEQRMVRLDGERKDTNKQQRALQEEHAKLKDMMIKTCDDSFEPQQADLTRALSDIISIIQKICSKMITNNYMLSPKPQVHDNIKNFYIACEDKPLSIKAFRWRMRAEVFRLIHREILNKPSFGLPRDCEQVLASLEGEFSAKTTDRAVIEWRQQTLRFLEVLGPKTDIKERVQFTSQYLFKYTKPLLHLENAVRDSLKHDIDDLCVKAYRLNLHMRHSRSDYEVFTRQPGAQLTDVESDEVTVEGAENDKLGDEDVPGSEVHYTISGGLARQDFGMGESVVLEKATVVFRKVRHS